MLGYRVQKDWGCMRSLFIFSNFPLSRAGCELLLNEGLFVTTASSKAGCSARVSPSLCHQCTVGTPSVLETDGVGE